MRQIVAVDVAVADVAVVAAVVVAVVEMAAVEVAAVAVAVAVAAPQSLCAQRSILPHICIRKRARLPLQPEEEGVPQQTLAHQLVPPMARVRGMVVAVAAVVAVAVVAAVDMVG